jgi:hypothetical protein
MNLIEFHMVGGLPWMLVLSAILVTNLILIIRIGMAELRQKSVSAKLMEVTKQLGGFALAFGAWSTLVAFFQAFRDLSAMAEMIPIQHIYGGLQVALITVLYGFGIFLFTMAALTGISLLKKE